MHTPTNTQDEHGGNAPTINHNSTTVDTSTAESSFALINNPTVHNPTPVQTKKYFCKHHVHIRSPSSVADHIHKGSYGNHGHNDSHNTEDCRQRKKMLQGPAHPGPSSNRVRFQHGFKLETRALLTDFEQGVRNILFSVAKQVVDKADKTRKAKQQESDWASYNNLELKMEVEELKKKLEDAKQEMRKRGIR